ncbi:MAG: undecaprenyldiphospho-muramoylpentapeptide beta-N-acetylglucosaminyltransferase [Ruminococcus sp.]|nr:undecaprenyldiphospho-muramoylpentapeptide beta-N-acetylglucosaminyltransferase [Ruminococcus sp.]MBQ3855683.1 undecaprenyldiphospho-muramoylpentapeptide beta-N-acetylglucosaminyltransferase [Ruminococcus sp.]MBQ8122945.1 undecaprenyldiphospho-muramoylpentapeptide beta-N-acetylglucosaminyltransferase [Ruminococcus sp.]HBB20757.1 undecaprenyldiphospho-muramoylpentapeptide beta-N-acetylglucosaminyltransferase [Ruminococcus sp.]HOO06695.1 undecaprenyldiphospho-muramoylpentapeptide beta-N-acetyl
MRVLIACGGTGGHINPGLAIADIIKSKYPDAEFLFAGTPKGMEARLVPQAGFRLETIKVAGFQRSLSLENIGRNIKAVTYLATSGKRAKEIVAGFKPDIAIGTGGYAAGPVIRKAARMGIPSAIHEQNAYPGVTNKLLAKEVDYVMLTVKEALNFMDKDKFEYSVTGLPVRSTISEKLSKSQARAKLGFDDSFTILSFGGSLGAGCINSTMTEAIKWHVGKGLKINHIHGYGGMGKDSFPQAMKEAGIPLKNDRLRITEYINDMDVCLAAADLVVCRSGASTLAELEAAGKASILIPSPIVAGNHQYHNAMVLGKAGAAIVIEQKDASNERIISEIEKLSSDPAKVASMGEAAGALHLSDTNERILAVIDKLIAKGKK